MSCKPTARGYTQGHSALGTQPEKAEGSDLTLHLSQPRRLKSRPKPTSSLEVVQRLCTHPRQGWPASWSQGGPHPGLKASSAAQPGSGVLALCGPRGTAAAARLTRPQLPGAARLRTQPQHEARPFLRLQSILRGHHGTGASQQNVPGSLAGADGTGSEMQGGKHSVSPSAGATEAQRGAGWGFP